MLFEGGSDYFENETLLNFTLRKCLNE